MRSITISVTEAARNFADCINRVRYQGISFILHKNGVAVARIVPERSAMAEIEPAEKPATPEAIAGGNDVRQAQRASIPEIW